MDIYDFDSQFEVLCTELEKVTYKDGDYCAGRWRSSVGQQLRKMIAESQSRNFNTVDEKIWALRNRSNFRPLCSCGNNLNFKNSSSGFFKSCSRKCASSNPSTKEKIKNTLLERYGSHHMQNEVWINNFVKSCRDKGSYRLMRENYISTHGSLFPNTNKEQTFIKAEVARFENGYNYKLMTYPSGKTIKVQGYEPQVIDYLLKAGIKEEDIDTCRTIIPRIPYTYEEKQLHYIPDIFVESKKLLVDVVSGYSWQKNGVKNLSKHTAVKNAGFNHLIVIWDDSRNCIKEILN